MKRTFTLTAIAGIAIGLAGCSMGDSQATGETTSVAAQDEASVDSPDGSVKAGEDTDVSTEPEESTDADSDRSADSDEPSGGADSERADYETAVTRRLDCTPGTEDISGTGEVVAITASCDSVTISGTGSIVLTEDVDNLTVSGDGVKVIMASVETITVSGSGNQITWESGDPQVQDSGTTNLTSPAS